MTVSSRTAERPQELAEEVGCQGRSDWAARHSVAVDMLVNCTPVGMHPNVDETPVHPSFLKPGLIVFDTVYTPGDDAAGQGGARRRGCHVVTGVDMFVRQAALQFELFTGLEPPLDAHARGRPAGAVAGDLRRAGGRRRRNGVAASATPRRRPSEPRARAS